MACGQDTVAVMVRQALARQARQVGVVLGVAMLGLLLYAPATSMLQAIVAASDKAGLRFEEVPVLTILGVAELALVEELASAMIRGKLRISLLVGVCLVHAAAWAIAAAAVAALGYTGSVAWPSAIFGALVYATARPIAIAFMPLQTCKARLRRTAREIKTIAMRICAILVGFSVSSYLYLTVFIRQSPRNEFLVMGVLMPVFQAVVMSLLARSVRQREGIMVSRKQVILDEADARGEAKTTTSELQLAATTRTRKTAAPRKRSPLRDKRGSQVSFMVAMCAESTYATGAFSALALAESDQTFFMSLMSMLVIEIVQVTLHVKARRVVSRVVSEGTGAAMWKNESRLGRWIMFQELGEKLGVLAALGILAIDKSLRERDVPAVRALSMERLARRGLAMVAMELIGDVLKDLATQALGLVADNENSRASLPRLGFAFALVSILCAALQAQGGLAFGVSA